MNSPFVRPQFIHHALIHIFPVSFFMFFLFFPMFQFLFQTVFFSLQAMNIPPDIGRFLFYHFPFLLLFHQKIFR